VLGKNKKKKFGRGLERGIENGNALRKLWKKRDVALKKKKENKVEI